MSDVVATAAITGIVSLGTIGLPLIFSMWKIYKISGDAKRSAQGAIIASMMAAGASEETSVAIAKMSSQTHDPHELVAQIADLTKHTAAGRYAAAERLAKLQGIDVPDDPPQDTGKSHFHGDPS